MKVQINCWSISPVRRCQWAVKKAIGAKGLYLIAAILGFAAQTTLAQTPVQTEEAKLLPPSGVSNAEWGTSVAVDGDTAIIRSRYNTGDVFTRDTNGNWFYLQELQVDGLGNVDGSEVVVSVAVDGDTALIGAESDGGAYVFVRDSNGSWTQQQELLTSEGRGYGLTVALDGDTIVLGVASSAAGVAHVFIRNSGGTWVKQQELIASDRESGDGFGFSIALDGDIAVFGAPFRANGDVIQVGAAYVFARDGSGVWTEQQKLLPSDDSRPDNEFGISAALDGNTALIGRRGSAYVFTRDSAGVWSEQQKLGTSDYSVVSLEGDIAAVGTYRSNTVRIFSRHKSDEWVEKIRLKASDGQDPIPSVFGGDALGYFGGVSISGNTVLAGAPYNDDAGFRSGSAYVFDLELLQQVSIDIKPGSEPNCFNANGRGVIPVAILGDEFFDVSSIDQTTLSFGGSTVRVRGNKGAFCGLEDVNTDGFYDLVCQFEDNPEYWEPGQADATLTGAMLDGTSIEGTDTICIVP